MKTLRLFAVITVALAFVAYSPLSAQFSVSITPSESAATVGVGSAIYNVSVQADAGFEATIFLSAESSMSGVVTKLSKSSLNKPYGNLTLTASPKSDTGMAVITISATAGSVTKTAECRLRALKNPQWKVIIDSTELVRWGIQLTHDARRTIVGVEGQKMTYFLADGERKTELFPSIVQGMAINRCKIDRTGAMWLLGSTTKPSSYVSNAIGHWKQNNFIAYTNENSTLGGSDVCDLDFDRNNVPVVMLYDGSTKSRLIQKYEDGEWKDIVRHNNSIFHSRQICIDSTGALWFSDMSNGVYRMRGSEIDTFTTSNSSFALEGVDIICCDSRGAVWCFSSLTGFASVYNGTTWEKIELAYNGTNIAFDSKNSLWMLAGSKMIKRDSNGITVYDASNTPLPKHFNSVFSPFSKTNLIVDADDNIWIGLRDVDWQTELQFAAIFNPDGLKGIPLVLSAEEPEFPASGVVISPNPAAESFTVHYPENATVTVRDVFGRVAGYQVQITNGETVISTVDFVSGVYFVEIRTASGRRTVEKVVVSR